MEKKIKQITRLIAKSSNNVVVTGAGISTEAGIPDFRGPKGIYRQLGENKVMNIININFFNQNPQAFYDFYRQHFMFPPVEPSKAHLMLAKIEAKGKLKGIVTQNIDNLHQKAGSKRVIPIHGNANRFICTNRNCRTAYDSQHVEKHPAAVPVCTNCGGVLKPDVVLFGEHIQNYHDAYDLIRHAKVLIVIGSSLTVYPLAGFVKEFSTFTQDLVIINKGRTELDNAAKVKVSSDNTGDVLEQVYNSL